VNRPIKQTAGFARAIRRLLKRNPEIRQAVQESLLQLESDAFDARLRTHKLKGELADSWACSVAYDLRIVFDFVDDAGIETIYLSIGQYGYIALGTDPDGNMFGMHSVP